jgi:hypothetical protein
MEKLLNSNLEVVIRSGFLYLPLLFDPEIAGEISHLDDHAGMGPHSHIILVSGKLFIKTLRLSSIVENYEKMQPRSYQRYREKFIHKFWPGGTNRNFSLETNLRTIIFEVLPHFLRRSSGFSRQRRSEGEVLDLIREKLAVPQDYDQMAGELAQSFAWHRSRTMPQPLRWEEPEESPAPPEEGLIATQDLRSWLHPVLARKIWEQEKARLQDSLKEQEELMGLTHERRAVLLYLAAVGSLEIDGFGFIRLRLPDDYLIYRRTGEFALKDFYGRVYLFPDCRVAVSTMPPLKPVVLEKYKHPLLHRHAPGQAICISQDFVPPRIFSGANAIAALEEGVNALFFNYNCRGIRGYHKLGVVKRPHQGVDFDDLKISRDHPGLFSGRIEIKNDFT